MLSATGEYRAAIVGDVRRMHIKALLEIVAPDIAYGTVSSSGVSPWSRPEQLYDRQMDLDSRYATLERNRWLLDGSFRLIPDDPKELMGEIGFVGDVLSGADGAFPQSTYVELPLENVAVLQACAVYFSDQDFDGIPVDFKVEVKQGGTAYYAKTITGNTGSSISLDGFTVRNPDAIRVTVTKWSLPGRYLRIAEIIPGVYEEWTEDVLAAVDIQARGNFACLAMPYGTCTLRMDNLDRRFEPRNKTGVFQSIEERQAIPVSLGVELADGSMEWKRVGVFYQYSGGWRTGDNAVTMQWELVDIVGLLADRDFVTPDTLPTTLGGWIGLLAAQLGTNFANRWHVDPDYADAPVTANSTGDVAGRKCGDILRFACMAAGCWPRADAGTGDLTAEPFWDQGNKLDLDNMTTYPTMKANDDLAVLIFKLYDGEGTTININGNATSSSKTLSVDNPFIHTAEQARLAARQILSQYGGMKLETTGRGDPSSEIGDVDTVWLDASGAATGRRMEQSFSFSNGVLMDCKSTLLQADGSYLFTESAIITQSGTWKAPAGVTRLRVVIGQGGQGGMKGQDGYLRRAQWENSVEAGYGEPGQDGSGGKIWHGTIDINEQQEFVVNIGQGGAPSQTYGVPGAMGGETTFGPYSSANGTVYPLGYTDISNGSSFGRTGVEAPAAGTGDGGKGGDGGEPGVGYLYQEEGDIGYRFKRVKEPGPGKPGKAGASGFVLVFWDKPEA